MILLFDKCIKMLFVSAGNRSTFVAEIIACSVVGVSAGVVSH